PRHWRSAPASASHSAPSSAPASSTSALPTLPLKSGHRYGSAAQPSAPSTSAPSPPITTSPARAGSATASAVSISGAARCSVFCQENMSPNAPLNSRVHASSALTPPSSTHTPNSSSAPASASSGSTTASIAERIVKRAERSQRRPRAAQQRDASHLADDAFDQVVHRLELEVRLLEGLAGGDHLLAGVVLQRPLEDIERALEHRGAHVLGVLLGRVGHHRPVRRALDEAVLQAAAHEVGMRLARLRRLDDRLVGGDPVPLGAGEVGVGRQLGLRGVVA